MHMCSALRRGGKRSGALVALVLTLRLGAEAQETPAYRDAKAPVEQRVADLLGRMTLEEKVAQLVGTWQNKSFIGATNPRIVDEKGIFDAAQAGVLLKHGLGEMSRPSENRGPREMAEFTNSIQKWLKENTRLGIPILFHEECLHGNAAPKAASFPQAIALASTWDPALVQEVFTSVAAEVRAKGAQECLAPVLGARSGARPAMGSHGRNVWGRSLPGFADRGGGDSWVSRRSSIPRQGARLCHGETFCGAWAARSGHKCGSGKLFGARHSRIFLEAV